VRMVGERKYKTASKRERERDKNSEDDLNMKSD
jgi:hypothetical protein